MKNLSSGIKIGILVLVAAGVGYYTFKRVGTQVGEGGYRLWANFRDVSGLPEGKRVVVAGLPVGEIVSRSLDGRLARLTVRIAPGTRIYSNSGIYKKSSSLLGEYYVDIDPGLAELRDKDGNLPHLLKDGDEIVNVFEAAGTDTLIRSVNETLPNVNRAIEEIRLLVVDTRKIVNGPVASVAGKIDDTIAKDAELVDRIIQSLDRTVATVELVAKDVRGVTRGSDEKVDKILANAQQVTEDLQDLIATTKGEITTTGTSVREKLDRIDSALVNLENATQGTSDVVDKLNDPDQGTLGRLVNDSTIADNIEAITEDVSGFVKTAFGIKTVVGIRGEYHARAHAYKTALSVELFTRPDKFYLVELVSDPRGKVSESYVFDEASGSLERTTTVEPRGFRVTFQFAKKINPFTFRIGIMESSGGAGVDAQFLDDRLKISADVFETSFQSLPRLRFIAAYNFFRYFYIYGGADDVLNPAGQRTIPGETLYGLTDSTYTFGRDYFGGMMLRFTDDDLSALLFIGGSAIAAGFK